MKEFHAWVSEMENSIIDESTIDKKKVKAKPSIIDKYELKQQMLKASYYRAQANWIRQFNRKPESPEDGIAFCILFLSKVLDKEVTSYLMKDAGILYFRYLKDLYQ